MAELRELRATVEALRQELHALAQRTKNVEENYHKLDMFYNDVVMNQPAHEEIINPSMAETRAALQRTRQEHAIPTSSVQQTIEDAQRHASQRHMHNAFPSVTFQEGASPTGQQRQQEESQNCTSE